MRCGALCVWPFSVFLLVPAAGSDEVFSIRQAKTSDSELSAGKMQMLGVHDVILRARTSSYFHVTGPGAAVAPNVCVLRVCAQVVAVKCGDDEGAQGVPWGT